jgi:hypothetical protein
MNDDDSEGVFNTPPKMTVHAALYGLFVHYCQPLKASASREGQESGTELSMDGATFAKFIRDCPHLGKRVGRTNVDLVFSKSKPVGIRRLDYEHFLDAILGIARSVFPDEEPTCAFASILAYFIFGLFDVERSPPQQKKKIIESLVSSLTTSLTRNS